MKGSALVGILVAFAGYTITSYGYVMIRGWNIPLRQWVSPLNPYIWSGDPGTVPDGQIFPSQANAGAGTAGATIGQSAQQAANAALGLPLPTPPVSLSPNRRGGNVG